MSEKSHYVYLTTNLITGKQYVGDHTINPKEKRYYIGSGKPYFESAKKKYGTHNFFKEILEWFPTREEAYEAQEKYIIQFNTLSPSGYNISPKGGYGVNESFLGEETKEKLRKINTGKKWGPMSAETKKLIGEANKISLKGRTLSEEHKKHMQKPKSEEAKKNMGGRIPWNKNKITGPLSDDVKKNMSNGKKGCKPWNTGKTWTEEQKKNLYNRVPWNKGLILTK
jgi:group I intron endonuclease